MSIFTLYSRPEQNPALEEKIRTQLKSIDSLLDIKWMPHAVFSEKGGELEGRYCLACDWPTGDSRWEMYQTGEIQEHFDMLGWFCTDIHDANSVPVEIDSIESKVIELLGKCDNTRHSWRDKMKQIVEKNAKVRKDKKQVYLDQTQDIAEVLHHAVGHKEAVTVERMMREIANGEVS